MVRRPRIASRESNEEVKSFHWRAPPAGFSPLGQSYNVRYWSGSGRSPSRLFRNAAAGGRRNLPLCWIQAPPSD